MTRPVEGPWPMVIDIEASGFGPGSYPIEVGFVMPDGTAHCTLVRPAPGWTMWDPQAEAVHHLTRHMLQSYGRTVDDVAYWLNGHLDGHTVYTDAWGHDYTWLSVLYEAAGSQPTFRLDTVRSLIGEAEVERWHPLRDHVQQRMSLSRHRASSDARVVQQALRELSGKGLAGG